VGVIAVAMVGVHKELLNPAKRLLLPFSIAWMGEKIESMADAVM
jgi:hypothetical protein